MVLFSSHTFTHLSWSGRGRMAWRYGEKGCLSGTKAVWYANDDQGGFTGGRSKAPGYQASGVRV